MEGEEWSKASSGTFDETASFGGIIVLATSWEGTENAITMAGKNNFKEKIVIDITNPLDFSGSVPPKIAVDVHNSGGEIIQKWLPESKVVKTLNIINSAYMTNPSLPDGPPDMFLCGNDENDKEKVKEILVKWGWPVTDLGGIENSRYLEALAMIWIVYAFKTKKWTHAFKLINK